MKLNFPLHAMAIALGACLQPAAVAAAASQPTPQIYFGAAAGRSSFDIDTAGASRSDTHDTGYRFFAGMQFSPRWGLEATAFDHGKASGAAALAGLGTLTVEGRVRGYSLTGTAALLMSDTAALYAKAGLARVRTKVTVVAGLDRGTQTDSSTQPVIGLGARWSLGAALESRLEWERGRARFLDAEKINTDLVSIGLQYRF